MSRSALALIGVLAGLFLFSVYSQYQVSVARLAQEQATDSIESLGEVIERDSLVVDSLHKEVDSINQAWSLRASVWDTERREARARVREASSEAARLRDRVRDLAPPNIQALLDSLEVEHAREVGGLRAQVSSLTQENDMLYQIRLTQASLINRQDSLLTNYVLRDEQRIELIGALESEIRHRKRERFGLALALTALTGYVLLK